MRARAVLVPLLIVAAAALPARTPAAAGQRELADAELVHISLHGKNLHAGQRVKVSIDVRNAGTAPLPPVPVVLTAGGRPYAEWRLPRELAPGEQVTWGTTFAGARGMHLLVATVDPLDDALEANKGNNSAFINVGVGERKPPFPWVGVAFGALFFLIGLGAGGLLRLSPKARPRRPRARRPVRPAEAKGGK